MSDYNRIANLEEEVKALRGLVSDMANTLESIRDMLGYDEECGSCGSYTLDSSAFHTDMIDTVVNKAKELLGEGGVK